MDSGCLEEEEALEDDFDFTKPLSAGQVLWLMDELTCREVQKAYRSGPFVLTMIEGSMASRLSLISDTFHVASY
jgi:Mak10 subunit, NatC N(alpha)-terminal acetyltransferase